LEAQLVQDEMEFGRLQRKAKQVQGQYTGGVIGLIVGVLMFFLFSGILEWIGVFLGICGLLATITGLVNRSSAERDIRQAEKDITGVKMRLVELRTTLAALGQ
jgi:uncharacterized membrane protein YgaE (UPF0421/DUF939 family)